MGPETSYEVLAIRYGSRMTERSDVFLNYPAYGEPDGPIGMDYFFWVARNAERTVVIDSGYSAAGGARRKRTMLHPPADALRTLGIDPAGVGQVVVSHGHYDHIGNLDAMSSAELVMSGLEYDFWTSPVAERALFAYSSEVADITELRSAQAQGRITRIAGTTDVAPGISVVEVGGHTPGQLLTLVNTPTGTVVLASDAIHYYEEIERDRPFSNVADLIGMYRAFDTLRDLQSQPGTIIVAGHDPDVLNRFDAYASDLGSDCVRVG
jgi:glyoxylase-like metal-dependent hydrolase (beta-lactamase superfamily II)